MKDKKLTDGQRVRGMEYQYRDWRVKDFCILLDKSKS